MIPLSKYATTGLVSAALLVAPFVSLAAGTSTTKVNAGFCSRVDTVTSNVEGHVSTVMSKITTVQTDRESKLASNRATRDAQLQADRDKAATERAAQYQKLQALATTSAEQAAVTQFENTINAGITARHQAVDAAIAAYRSGIDSIVQTKFATLTTDATTLEQSIMAAGTTAKNDCANGTASATVRTNYLSAVKAARSTFQGEREVAVIKAQIQTLDTTRKTAIDSAMSQFRSTAEAARATLKAAFGK